MTMLYNYLFDIITSTHTCTHLQDYPQLDIDDVLQIKENEREQKLRVSVHTDSVNCLTQD